DAPGGIRIEADVRGGRVRVAPGALQRLVEEQALPASREEQRVDGADQEPHAKRLVAAVAQPRVYADGVPARGGLERLREVAEHQDPRRVDAGARLREAHLHGGEFRHAAGTAPGPAPGGAYACPFREIRERA